MVWLTVSQGSRSRPAGRTATAELEAAVSHTAHRDHRSRAASGMDVLIYSAASAFDAAIVHEGGKRAGSQGLAPAADVLYGLFQSLEKARTVGTGEGRRATAHLADLAQMGLQVADGQRHGDVVGRERPTGG